MNDESDQNSREPDPDQVDEALQALWQGSPSRFDRLLEDDSGPGLGQVLERVINGGAAAPRVDLGGAPLAEQAQIGQYHDLRSYFAPAAEHLAGLCNGAHKAGAGSAAGLYRGQFFESGIGGGAHRDDIDIVAHGNESASAGQGDL